MRIAPPFLKLTRNLAFVALAICLSFGTPARAENLFDYLWGGPPLETVTADISKRYSDIDHITTQQLARKLDEDRDIILVDVRETDEYRVAHLPSAIHVTPNTSPQGLRAKLGPDIKNKDIVLYCSVGERSSRLAQRAKASLLQQGARTISNLTGGIFAWHNEKRPLENANGETQFVHPFDSHWGRLLERQDLTRTAPAHTAPPQAPDQLPAAP